MNVIIPAYKPDEKLLKLIDDLHENTDYNIIVVNDGSDHTEDDGHDHAEEEAGSEEADDSEGAAE